MVKLAFTTQKKPKLPLRKPKLNCKNKAFNSQFIWTTLSAKWTTAWSNKRAPSNKSALGADNVVVDLQKVSDDDFQNITYFSDTAAARDYDISGGGWAPDYQDPSTYLESISPVNGSVFYYLGIDAGSNNPAIATVGLDQYANMLKDADAELLDQAKRYEKYAAAQAWLTDSSITLPTVSNGGAPMLQRTVPYSRAASWVGTKGTGTFYKYLEMSKDVVTTKDFNKAKEEWLKKKAESNKKAQEDLKDHIEKKK